MRAEVHSDQRGFLIESYSRRHFQKAGISDEFVQDNVSFSRAGVLRGLHYQLVRPQAKLMRALTGRILDVAVDLRPGSPTFGAHQCVELTAQSGLALFIPAGFAHGVLALEDALLHYKLSAFYQPEHARGIAFDDPDLAIPWPNRDPLLSAQDRNWPKLSAAELPSAG